jgi:hypothetical protein
MNVDLQISGDVVRAAFTGALTEDFAGPAIPATAIELRLDLGGITRINSGGVRAWIQWLATLPATTACHVDHCSFAVTQQAVSIANFLPGEVHGFAVPYYCDACGHDDLLQVEPPTAPPEGRPCSACGATAQLDMPLDMIAGLLEPRGPRT